MDAAYWSCSMRVRPIEWEVLPPPTSEICSPPRRTADTVAPQHSLTRNESCSGIVVYQLHWSVVGTKAWLTVLSCPWWRAIDRRTCRPTIQSMYVPTYLQSVWMTEAFSGVLSGSVVHEKQLRVGATVSRSVAERTCIYCSGMEDLANAGSE